LSSKRPALAITRVRRSGRLDTGSISPANASFSYYWVSRFRGWSPRRAGRARNRHHDPVWLPAYVVAIYGAAGVYCGSSGSGPRCDFTLFRAARQGSEAVCARLAPDRGHIAGRRARTITFGGRDDPASDDETMGPHFRQRDLTIFSPPA